MYRVVNIFDLYTNIYRSEAYTVNKKKKGKKMRTETKQMSLKFCITFKCATFEDFTHIHKQPMQHVAEVSYTCNLPQRGKIN